MPSREAFLDRLSGGRYDAKTASDMAAYVEQFGGLLAEVHRFLVGAGSCFEAAALAAGWGGGPAAEAGARRGVWGWGRARGGVAPAGGEELLGRAVCVCVYVCVCMCVCVYVRWQLPASTRPQRGPPSHPAPFQDKHGLDDLRKV